MTKKSNPIGLKFNMLTPFEFSHSDSLHHRVWRCRCDCGNETLVSTRLLGKTISCGCIRKRSRRGVGKIYLTTFNKIKIDAANRGIPFSISIEYVWGVFESQKGICALSGAPLDFGRGKNGIGRTASLDRIDSERGYEEGNVQWVHRTVNVMKSSLGQKEFIDVCRRIVFFNLGIEMKQTNPRLVTPLSAGESPVMPAISYKSKNKRRLAQSS